MKKASNSPEHNFEPDEPEINDSKFDYIRLHIGTNSLGLALTFLVTIIISFKVDALNWSYLKGIDDSTLR